MIQVVRRRVGEPFAFLIILLSLARCGGRCDFNAVLMNLNDLNKTTSNAKNDRHDLFFISLSNTSLIQLALRKFSEFRCIIFERFAPSPTFSFSFFIPGNISLYTAWFRFLFLASLFYTFFVLFIRRPLQCFALPFTHFYCYSCI